MKKLIEKSLLLFVLSLALTSGKSESTEGGSKEKQSTNYPVHLTKKVYKGDPGVTNDDLQFTIKDAGAPLNLIPKDAKVVDLVKDYGVNCSDENEDTQKLQAAIDELSAKGGGVIYIPRGTYYIYEVRMKSNVHIQIESGATLKPFYKGDVKRFTFFTFRGSKTVNGKEVSDQIENVSICGVNGRFNIDLTTNTRERQSYPFGFSSVKNFMVSDITILDAKTPFPLLVFGPDNGKNPDIFGPTNGTIKNISAFNCHYGYGVVQAHCGKKLWFENLYGLGGVTLRFETGAAAMNDTQFSGLFDCIGKDIVCENGNAAVMIAPHSMHNGVVQIDGVKSIGAGFAVRTEGGYISDKYKNPAPGVVLDGGSFADGCFVKNVVAIYGNEAQVKPKHTGFYPKSLLYLVDRPTVDKYWSNAPAVATVAAKRYLTVKYGEVISYGFLNDPVMNN